MTSYFFCAKLYKMSEHEVVNVEGTVEESLPNSTFMVKLSSGQTILAYLSGKMRKNFIKVMPGDKVKIELTPYDLTKGRIVSREKITYWESVLRGTIFRFRFRENSYEIANFHELTNKESNTFASEKLV